MYHQTDESFQRDIYIKIINKCTEDMSDFKLESTPKNKFILK